MIILVVFMITIIDHSVTLVLLIISQVLGHKSFASYGINDLHLLNMNEVKIQYVFSVTRRSRSDSCYSLSE